MESIDKVFNKKKEGLFLLFSAMKVMNLGFNDLQALDAKLPWLLWSEHIGRLRFYGRMN